MLIVDCSFGEFHLFTTEIQTSLIFVSKIDYFSAHYLAFSVSVCGFRSARDMFADVSPEDCSVTTELLPVASIIIVRGM